MPIGLNPGFLFNGISRQFKIASIVINSSGDSSCLQRIFVISEIAFRKSTPSDPLFEPKIFLQSSPSKHDGPAAPFVFNAHFLIKSGVMDSYNIGSTFKIGPCNRRSSYFGAPSGCLTCSNLIVDSSRGSSHAHLEKGNLKQNLLFLSS